MIKNSISLLVLIMFFAACTSNDKNEHTLSHDLDIAPFSYVASLDSEKLILKITPNDEGLIYYPYNFRKNVEISDTGDLFIGDLILSTERTKSDMTYIHEEEKLGVATILELSIKDEGRLRSDSNLDLAVHICSDCIKESKVRRNKIHKRGHLLGRHFHLKIDVE